MIKKRFRLNSTVLIFGILVLGITAGVMAQGEINDRASESALFGAEDDLTDRFYLPLVAVSEIVSQPITLDLAQFMIGDGWLYEVRHQDGSQERIQTQTETGRFFHAKGENDGKWEELWATDEYIYRGTDTSPANDHITGKEQYYTLREDGLYGSPWAPRYWKVGQIFERNPLVSFYNKDGCVFDEGGTQRSWLKLVAYYPTYNVPGPLPGGITLTNVIQLAWLLTPDSPPIENYFYAQSYGLVGWSNDQGKQAFISEIHQPGTRPPIIREEIPCLNTSGQPDEFALDMPIGILPPPNRAK